MGRGDAIKRLRAQAEGRRIFAREAFAAFSKEDGINSESPSGSTTEVTAEFREVVGDPLDELLKQAHFHDMVIVSTAPEHPASSELDLSALILAAGRPVLLAPPMSNRAQLGRVAIAWKTCAEAARALSAAMPILKMAKSGSRTGSIRLPSRQGTLARGPRGNRSTAASASH